MNVESVLSMNIFKVWSKFILASVVGVVLNTVYSIVDGIFVGQGVGEVGLASVNIAWPAVTVVIGTGLMLGIGASSIIAIHLGKGEKEEAEKVLGTLIKSILILGFIIMSVGLVLRTPILKMLGASDPEVFNYAKDYFTVIYLITIPYICSTALNPIVRTDGKPNLSMIMIGCGAICNIILDYILVIVFDFGVKGAAIATSASIFLSTVISIYYFTKGSSNIKIKKEYLKLDVNILKEIIKIGFVSFAIQMSYGLIILVQNNLMLAYGTTIDVAIYSVATYINCFFVNTCMGISQGLQPLIGYHYGAKKFDRMKKLLNITIGVCIAAGILVYIGIFLHGRELVQVFGVDPENVETAYNKILLYCMGSPIIGMIFTMSGYYQAIGKNMYANIISIGRGFVFQFILSISLPTVMGTTGVFLSLPLSEALTLIILMVILVIEKKKKDNQIEEEFIDEIAA